MSFIEGVHVSTSIARYSRKFNVSTQGKKPHEIVEEAEGLILNKQDALLHMHNVTVFDTSTHDLSRKVKPQRTKPSSVIASLTDQRLPVFGDDDDNLSDLMLMAETQSEVTIDAMRMRELLMELRRIRKELRTRDG